MLKSWLEAAQHSGVAIKCLTRRESMKSDDSGKESILADPRALRVRSRIYRYSRQLSPTVVGHVSPDAATTSSLPVVPFAAVQSYHMF